jgi:hypothetical protein
MYEICLASPEFFIVGAGITILMTLGCAFLMRVLEQSVAKPLHLFLTHFLAVLASLVLHTGLQ